MMFLSDLWEMKADGIGPVLHARWLRGSGDNDGGGGGHQTLSRSRDLSGGSEGHIP